MASGGLLPSSATLSTDITPDITIGAPTGGSGDVLGSLIQFVNPTITINGGVLDGQSFAPFGQASGLGLVAFIGIVGVLSLLSYLGWKAVLEGK
jgi:hypothetical protein